MPSPRGSPGRNPEDDRGEGSRSRGAPQLPDGPTDRLAAVVESADVAILATDLEGKITTWNAAAERLFGWKAKEIVGMPMLALAPPEHRTQAWQFHERARKGEPVRSYETVRWRKDRSRVDVVANVSPIRRGDGDIFGVSVIYRDITEWRHAEEALRLSEERFRALIENSQDAIELTDEAGFIVYLSPSISRVLGLTPDDLVGKRMSELFHPGDIPRMMAFYEDLVRTPGKVAFAEWRALHKDGTWRWLEGHGTNMLHDPAVRAVVSNFRDVTERKQRELELVESEESLRAILNSAIDAVITMDGSGKVRFFNPAASKTFGYSNEEAVGRALADLIIPAALRPRHWEGLRRYLETGEEVVLGRRLELNAVRKDGSEFPVELSITRVEKEGEPLFTGYVRDLTERKAAEEALKMSEERFRKLVEHSADAISVVNPQGTVLYVSPALETNLGYSPGEVMGRNGLEFIHPEDLPRAAEVLQDLAKRPGESVYLIQRLRHKDGSWRWMDGTVTNLLEEPSVRGVVSNFRDITDRVEAQRLLEESELRYHIVARASNEAIWDWDLVADTVRWTDGMRALFGYKQQDVDRARTSFYDFIHPEDRERVALSIHDLIDKGATMWESAYRFKRADGAFAFVTSRGFVIQNDEGKAVRFIGTVADVTERKALDQMRENLIDVISHEFRTPITIIQGYAEILSAGQWHPSSEESQKAKERIGRASKHLTFLLGSISELSLLHSGTFEAKVERLETLGVLRDAVQTMEVRRGGAGRVVHVDVAPGAEHISADARKLVMALVELVDNATKFSPEGSEIRLSAAPEGPRVAIAVQDEGPGMPEGVRADLFRPFTQADMSAARKAGGAGLGLALVGGLVRAQGGEIAVDSAAGRGTTVRVLLPSG